MVDAGGSRCKEASQSVSQLFQAAKPPPPYAPGRRAKRRAARRGVSQRAATPRGGGGRPGPGHVARARGSRQNPASSSVAKLFECRAKRWQSPPVEPYTSANGLSRRHASCDRRRVTGAVRRRARSAAVRGRDFDLPRHSHYSGVIPMVFEHSATRARGSRVVPYHCTMRLGSTNCTWPGMRWMLGYRARLARPQWRNLWTDRRSCHNSRRQIRSPRRS